MLSSVSVGAAAVAAGLTIGRPLWRQVLALQGARHLTHFGRHQRKLDMVTGSIKVIVSVESAKSYAGVPSPRSPRII